MSQPIMDRQMTQVDVEGTKRDVEAIFCYLDDMLCSCAVWPGEVQETIACPHLQAPLS